MSYVVLARKYRPQQFDDLVGQIPVSQTLINALETGRIAHAYVFSGPRGVGKTTTARILAKCLNCEKGTSIKPCNQCASCVAISQGSSMQDVLEIDGASNRGIEQIRELRESAKYAPTSSRYRIFIIDEAHQITKDAFGALLKTLEEPPDHVVFMMATTEVQKIPAPILSRCQRFSLRPISSELVFKHLKEICKAEKVEVEDAALADIVRFVEGSLRDALSLLDQAMVFSSKKITSQTLRDLLGLLPQEVILEFANAIAAGDPALILKKTSEAIQNGIDLMQLAKDLQDHYHSVLLAKAGVQDGFQLHAASLTEEASRHEFSTLERNIRLLAEALETMRRSETPRAVFEVSALRLGQKTLDPRLLVERLEKLQSGQSESRSPIQTFGDDESKNIRRPGNSQSGASRPATFNEPVSRSLPAGRQGQTETFRDDESKKTSTQGDPGSSIRSSAVSSPQSSAVSSPQSSVASSPQSSAVSVGDLTDAKLKTEWLSFTNRVAESKQVLAAALEEARPTLTPQGLLLTFAKTFSQQTVMRGMDLVRQTFAQHFGTNLAIETRVDAQAKPAVAAAAPASPQLREEPINLREPDRFEEVAPEQATEEAKKVLKHFPGTVKKERKPS